MTGETGLVCLAGLCVIGGAGCFYAGYVCAQYKHLRQEKKAHEKTDKILRRSATLTRGECLRRLRGGP